MIEGLEGERIKYLNRQAEKQLPDQHEHTLQITSYGGCGTTLLYRFFSEHGVYTPPAVDDWYPWKHMLAPPPDDKVKEGFRAVYVYADPFNATLSVFRRGFQHELVRRMARDTSGWNTDWELGDFLSEGTDYFRLTEQYRKWTEAERSYPILLLKYESMWEYLPELMTYVGLPKATADSFPEKRPRSSSWQDEPEEVQEKLEAIYGDLHNEIWDAPEFRIV
ncbi:hypothetical protein [Salinibacter ruber]|uniref:hypothetical protein n=1 Tax=Salinibacter ruber TaxID=146919 RepID=UPI00216A3446|nr:hypothetical protein [Salinibacter ruber]MCS3642377.1 hypothetical protein [Salinibacter ruber]